MSLFIAISALWLGVVTSVSPCTLTMNVLAITFIARQGPTAARALLGSLAYLLGLTLTYVALAALAVWGLMDLPTTSQFLQKHMNELLGPILIVVGMVLAGLVRIPLAVGVSERTSRKAAASGPIGAAALGAIFAISFCPVSAAMFFGGLLPLALSARSCVLLPALYGLGVAVPVIALAVLMSIGTALASRAISRAAAIEKWTRLLTGAAFILAGTWLCLRYVFGVL